MAVLYKYHEHKHEKSLNTLLDNTKYMYSERQTRPIVTLSGATDIHFTQIDCVAIKKNNKTKNHGVYPG